VTDEAVAGTTHDVLTGWGRTAPSASDVAHPGDPDALAAALESAPPRGVLVRGLGRSYGDSAQNAGGRVVDATGVSGLVDLDLRAGTATALAGTSLDDLMRWLVPLGWFVPVTPGTRYVTVGGAVANDVHGKNHHRGGSWCDHVRSLTIVTPAQGKLTLTPEGDPELFWATAGGLGLTGVIVDVTFDLHPIETSLLLVDTDRAANLDEVMALMDEGDARYEYSVAWIDPMAKGRSLGRSILDRGRFANLAELPAKKRRDPLAYRAGVLVNAPLVAPPRLLNPLTTRAFNEVWFRKAPRRRHGHLQSIPAFFHPLDMVGGWNRLYGPPGFLQWQFVVPFGAEETLRRIVEQLSDAGCTSFLAVLKRFGDANPGPLSFPQPGWTLALDTPADDPRVGPLFDRLDEQVVRAGGRVYLAKDSRVRPELLPAMYPRLDEWRSVRRRVDPDGVLQSDLARRLRLLD
jgi:decaprenylphospho-beta-D-ribofuranose 2-oxidase